MSKNSFVKHIGAVFLYTKNMHALVKWYENVLGMQHEFRDGFFYCVSFDYKDSENKQGYILWGIVENKELSNNPREKTHLINLKVNDIKETISHIKSQGIEVKGIEEYDAGLFAWITDPDGNIIELWEDTNL